MRRVLFDVPGLEFRLHGFSVMLLLACFCALFLTTWRARREKIDPEAVSGLALWLITGGFIGARLFYVAQHPEAVQKVGDLLKIWQGGIVFYGCIVGGLLGSLIFWWRRPFPFWAMADAVAPALALGAALGRLGCFLNGCCFGAASERPWAMPFPHGSPPWARHVEAGLVSPTSSWSLPVHPTQLYAALAGLMLLGLLMLYYPRRRRDGEVMALLMIGYSITRFLVDGLRDDEPAVVMGLTASQGISVVLLFGGLIAAYRLSRLPRGRFADSALPPPKAGALTCVAARASVRLG